MVLPLIAVLVCSCSHALIPPVKKTAKMTPILERKPASVRGDEIQQASQIFLEGMPAGRVRSGLSSYFETVSPADARTAEMTLPADKRRMVQDGMPVAVAEKVKTEAARFYRGYRLCGGGQNSPSIKFDSNCWSNR